MPTLTRCDPEWRIQLTVSEGVGAQWVCGIFPATLSLTPHEGEAGWYSTDEVIEIGLSFQRIRRDSEKIEILG